MLLLLIFGGILEYNFNGRKENNYESTNIFAAIEKFDIAFKELKPDIVLLLGDRYEIMAVAQAVMLNNLPIAHVSGGDITQGAIDDAIRHSITKMSHIHFTSCEEYSCCFYISYI